MIEWTTSTGRTRVDHRGRAAVGKDGGALQAALVAFCAKTLDELEAQPEDHAWDIFVVQFITQCGSLVAVPMRKGEESPRSARFSVSLDIDRWADLYEALPDPDKSEVKFEKAYDRLHKDQVSALKKALGDPSLKTRLNALKRRRHFAVFGVDEGETSVLDRMDFLWGNRPSKRDFADANALFEYMFNKAELTPKYSMVVKDGKVLAVHFFGAGFTNSYVDLLEDVPNLQALCVDLKDVIVASTRIDAAGLKRLEALLPMATVTLVKPGETDPWSELRW